MEEKSAFKYFLLSSWWGWGGIYLWDVAAMCAVFHFKEVLSFAVMSDLLPPRPALHPNRHQFRNKGKAHMSEVAAGT